MEGMGFSKVMEVPGRKKLRLQVCITQPPWGTGVEEKRFSSGPI